MFMSSAKCGDYLAIPSSRVLSAPALSPLRGPRDTGSGCLFLAAGPEALPLRPRCVFSVVLVGKLYFSLFKFTSFSLLPTFSY